MRFHVIDTPDVVQLGDIQVSALRNIHPPLVDTFALSFKTARSHVVFSGDTAYFPDLAGFAQGADLLVHEAMLEAAIEALLTRVGNSDERLRAHFYAAHSTAAEAAKIAVAANVKALALNHLIPSDDPDSWGRLNIAHERYSVSDCTYLMSFACLPPPPGFRLMRTARADITTQKSLGTTLGSERLAASVVLKSRST